MIDTLTLETYAPRIGETFQIRLQPDQTVAAELVEARLLPSGRSVDDEARRTPAPFAIVFRASTVAVLPQRIYRIEHPIVGEHDLFIVPIAGGPDGFLYEAVFT